MHIARLHATLVAGQTAGPQMCLSGQVMPSRKEEELGAQATMVQCTSEDDLNFCCAGSFPPPAPAATPPADPCSSAPYMCTRKNMSLPRMECESESGVSGYIVLLPAHGWHRPRAGTRPKAPASAHRAPPKQKAQPARALRRRRLPQCGTTRIPNSA
jgi:hypothetical protein